MATIHSVGPEDRQAWLRMRCALWPHHSMDEHAAEIDAHLARAAMQVWVARTDDGRTVGFLELSQRSYAEGCGEGPVPYIEGWYVDPAHRRQGLGRRLVEAAERWAREQGYREIASDCELNNAGVSERAHAALGYAEVERCIHFRKSLQTRRSELHA
jgi:aminoglycoside 6'-N-acetyltransferase I